MATLNQLGHLAVEEGQEQRADVRAVHIGIGHDDDAVVAQLVDVEVVGPRLARLGAHLANAGAQSCDEGQNFIAGEQLFVTRFFHVQNFAAQGQDGLKLSIPPLLGRTSGGVALDDVDFTKRWVFFLAIG